MAMAAAAAVFPISSNAFSVNSFSVPTSTLTTSSRSITSLQMSDDFPSDSSTEAIVEVESSNVEPTISDNLVSSILDELPSGPASTVTRETRAKINEVLLKLEAMNPTESPASSPLLNGVWNLKYAAGYDEDWALPSPTRQLALFLYSGGYSPGLFALSLASSLPSNLVEVGDLEISISRDQPRIEANVDVSLFGGVSNKVTVKAGLDSSSDVRLTETYESATVLGNSIDLPQAVQYSRDLYVTYLDEDVLVIRDGSGVPEILMRKQ